MISKIINNQEKPVSGDGGIIEPITTNPNLLLNPWFRVNQRGFTSDIVSGTHKTSIDRWELWLDGTYSLSNNQMSLSSGAAIAQNFETEKWNELNGETLTLSVMLLDGTIHSGTAVFSSSQNVAFITDGSVVNNSGTNKNMKAVVIAVSSAATIKAVKLEKGAYSTLHLDDAPNNTIELLKCQKYFVRLNGLRYKTFGYVLAETETVAGLFITLPTEMFTIPTISSTGTLALYDGSSTFKTVSALGSRLDMPDRRYGNISITSTGLTSKMYSLVTTSETSYIDIDADIKYQ